MSCFYGGRLGMGSKMDLYCRKVIKESYNFCQINLKLALILGHIWWPLRNMLIVALNAVKDCRVMFYFEISWNDPKRRFQSFGMSTFTVSVHQHVYIHCKFRDAKQYTKQRLEKKAVNNVRNGKKTKDVTGCQVLSHPTTKQIQSFLRTPCRSTWRSARSSPVRSSGRFQRVVLFSARNWC